jgi:hypothetical protein
MVPELNIAALSTKQTRELVFWYLLRLLDTDHKGYLPLVEVQQAFTTLFHYSRPTFYRHLRLGEAKLWQVDNNRITTIKIYGLETVCRAFHTSHLSRWAKVDVETFLKYPVKSLLWNTGAHRPKDFEKAYVHIKKVKDSLVLEKKHRVNEPISRKTLEETTGISRRQQQRYDVQAQTKIKKKRVSLQFIEVLVKGKTIHVPKKLNVYFSHAVQGQRGMLRKVSKQIRGSNESLFPGEAADKTLIFRRYFRTLQDCEEWSTQYHTPIEELYYHLDGELVQCKAIELPVDNSRGEYNFKKPCRWTFKYGHPIYIGASI